MLYHMSRGGIIINLCTLKVFRMYLFQEISELKFSKFSSGKMQTLTLQTIKMDCNYIHESVCSNDSYRLNSQSCPLFLTVLPTDNSI